MEQGKYYISKNHVILFPYQFFRNIKAEESPHLNRIQLDTFPYKLTGEGASIDNCFYTMTNNCVYLFSKIT